LNKKNIYLITPNTLNSAFFTYLPKLIKTKRIAFLQIRLKSLSKKKLIQAITKIKKIVNNKVKLIINDFPEIAAKLNCDGCHIGQKDLSIQQTKQIMKSNKIIGVTCHNSKELALSAEKYGASYLAFGSFFKTKTKKTKFKANPKLLQWAHKNLKTPVVAIGGINEENYKLLLQNGAKYIACSSYIWKNSKYNPLKALNQLK
jgi:thiamine-phosphate pyrophosphorylase